MLVQPHIKVFGGKGGTNTSIGTPTNIDEIGKPAVHLISGTVGSGKSVIGRNLAEAYGVAHAKAKTSPSPDLLVYSGSGNDPVWADLKGAPNVKMYDNTSEQEFASEVMKRYDRAIRAKESKVSVAPAGGRPPTTHEAMAKTVAQAKGAQDDSEEPPHRPFMVVIDDASSSGLLPSIMSRSPIAQPIQSHRHADMSVIAITQRYHNHNPWLRANASSVSVFPPKAKEEADYMKRELPVPHSAMIRGFDVATSKGSHHFIHVDMKNRIATHDFTGQPI